MNRVLTASLLLTVLTAPVSAQSPVPPARQPATAPDAGRKVFHPVATTGKLLTSDSREFWMTVAAGYRAYESIKEACSHIITDSPIRFVVLTMFRPAAASEPLPAPFVTPLSRSALSLTP